MEAMINFGSVFFFSTRREPKKKLSSSLIGVSGTLIVILFSFVFSNFFTRYFCYTNS